MFVHVDYNTVTMCLDLGNSPLVEYHFHLIKATKGKCKVQIFRTQWSNLALEVSNNVSGDDLLTRSLLFAVTMIGSLLICC